MLTARDKEQLRVLEAIRSGLKRNGRSLICAATGFGKGQCIKLIAENIKTSMLVVVPRVNLVRDLSQRLDSEIFCASLGEKNIGKVTVGTKQSLKTEISADLVILDEAHNYKPEFLETIDARFIIGMTATPWNDRGYIYGHDKFWKIPDYTFSIGQAIDAGFLSSYQIFGSQHAYEVGEYLKGRGDFTESEINKILEQPKHVEQVAEFIKICDHYKRKKVVILCANIEHAHKIYEEIAKQEPCMIIHSKIKKPHKRIEDYKKNNIRFCVSVMMLSEGTDIPQVDTIIYLRPTKSSRLMVQSAGRGLRLHDEKEFCLLLDYGHVFQNCGTPHSPIIPTNVGEKEEQEPNYMRQCEACFYIFDIRDAQDKFCPVCGHKNKTDRDAEKNLKTNIIEDIETFELIVNSSHIYKRGTSKNGLPYLTIKVGLKTYHTFFGKQVKWLLGSLRPDAKIVYTKEGSSKFKVLKIEPHRLIE